MPDMRIRIAEKPDFPTVKTITQTTILSVYPKYYPAGAVRFFSEHHSDEKILNDILTGKVYLLETEGGTAGTVTISGNEINRLFVLPGHQGRGYGSQLMDFAEQIIRRESDTLSSTRLFRLRKCICSPGTGVLHIRRSKRITAIICALMSWKKHSENNPPAYSTLNI